MRSPPEILLFSIREQSYGCFLHLVQLNLGNVFLCRQKRQAVFLSKLRFGWKICFFVGSVGISLYQIKHVAALAAVLPPPLLLTNTAALFRSARARLTVLRDSFSSLAMVPIDLSVYILSGQIKTELPDSDFERRRDNPGNLLIIRLIGQGYVINFYIVRRFIPNIEISFDICIRSVRDRSTRSICINKNL